MLPVPPVPLTREERSDRVIEISCSKVLLWVTFVVAVVPASLRSLCRTTSTTFDSSQTKAFLRIFTAALYNYIYICLCKVLAAGAVQFVEISVHSGFEEGSSTVMPLPVHGNS